MDPGSGLHLNIQGETWYEPPTWPEEPGSLTKMLHLEIEVDDLEAAGSSALDAGGTEAPGGRRPTTRSGIRTMLDPAGHPLCLFVHGE